MSNDIHFWVVSFATTISCACQTKVFNIHGEIVDATLFLIDWEACFCLTIEVESSAKYSPSDKIRSVFFDSIDTTIAGIRCVTPTSDTDHSIFGNSSSELRARLNTAAVGVPLVRLSWDCHENVFDLTDHHLLHLPYLSYSFINILDIEWEEGHKYQKGADFLRLRTSYYQRDTRIQWQDSMIEEAPCRECEALLMIESIDKAYQALKKDWVLYMTIVLDTVNDLLALDPEPISEPVSWVGER